MRARFRRISGREKAGQPLKPMPTDAAWLAPLPVKIGVPLVMAAVACWMWLRPEV